VHILHNSLPPPTTGGKKPHLWVFEGVHLHHPRQVTKHRGQQEAPVQPFAHARAARLGQKARIARTSKNQCLVHGVWKSNCTTNENNALKKQMKGTCVNTVEGLKKKMWIPTGEEP